MNIKKILEQVKDGSLNIDDAEKNLSKLSFEDLGFAKLDFNRTIRVSFPEVVFCQGKADDFLLNIYKKIFEELGEVFGTRASEEQAKLIKNEMPSASYDNLSRILKVENINANKSINKIGEIAICTAGTADISVAEEAAQTAEFFGSNVNRVYDIGVSGLHRLLAKLDVIQNANCIIAIAGMEGALASVIGGLVSVPIIAVPTSVGYGANFHGVSALLTMINSCANGVSVVNIDNGYGAAVIATQINRLACGKGSKPNA